jgi:hypothetical protein
VVDVTTTPLILDTWKIRDGKVGIFDPRYSELKNEVYSTVLGRPIDLYEQRGQPITTYPPLTNSGQSPVKMQYISYIHRFPIAENLSKAKAKAWLYILSKNSKDVSVPIVP